MSDTDEHIYEYEDDFDEHLLDELTPPPSNEDKEALLLQAKVSVIGSELTRALDASSLRSSMADMSSIIRQNKLTTQPSSSGSTQAAATSSSLRPPQSSSKAHLLQVDSARSVRQSQDLFSALDLANTDSTLKEQYTRYWDAVEEQCNREQEQVEALAIASHRVLNSKISVTQQQQPQQPGVEPKPKTTHQLAKLKAKMAAKEQVWKQESGWNDGFAYDRESSTQPTHPVIHARSPKANPPRFDRPSVVKASQALAQFMATTGATNAGAMSATSSIGNLSKTSTKAIATSSNAKPLPPAPSGVVDPSRIKKIVQTHMPAIVLAKLAASRRTQRQLNVTAAAGPSRGVSAKRTRTSSAGLKPNVSRMTSAGKERDGDEADEFAEEISPASKLTSAKSSKVSSTRSVANANPTNPNQPKTTIAPKPRAASAGLVKPTHSSALLAAERASQLQAASNPPDMKQVPLVQWNRLRKEVEDLRRKVVALEAENEQLRSGGASASPQGVGAGSILSPSHSQPQLRSSPEPSSNTNPTKPIVHTRATSAIAANRPSAAAAAKTLSSTVTVKSTAATNPSNAKPASQQRPTATVTNPALKLNLGGLITSPDITNTNNVVPTSSSNNPLVSPRARCAVSQCGANRVSGKPYCSQHLVSHPPTPTATATNTNTASASALFSPKQQQQQQPSPAAPAPTSTAPTGLGLKGMNLNLGSTTKEFNYDYESDDNYGGTDDENESSLDVSHLSMDDGSSSMISNNGGGNTQRAPLNGGDTARANANDGLTARGQPPEPTPRQQSSGGPIIYSSRDRHPNIPRPTPRVSTTARGVDVHAGGFDLEALRNSPYAGIDSGLNGSFEITQSGTFKRGGFSLNNKGMSSNGSEPGSNDGPSSANSFTSTPWDVASTTRPNTNAPSPANSSNSYRPSPTSSTASTPSSAASSASALASNSFHSLNIADLYTLGVLGRGSGGVVYRAFHAPTMDLIALKSIGIHEQDKRKQLTQELRTLTLQPNPYTIGFKGAYFDASYCYLALEFMNQGSLDDLRAQEGHLSEIECAFIFEQVLLGLKHLKSQGIIHRDIKPHNILYNDRGQFKLTDFGIISDWKDRSDQQAMAEAKTFVGTLLYMSPERIGGQTYSYACDIWSMALSLLTCRIGEFAIPHHSHWELVNAIQSGPAILNGQGTTNLIGMELFVFSFPHSLLLLSRPVYSSDQISDSLRKLLTLCLQVDPSKRPTAEECLQHEFFANYRQRGQALITIPPGFPPPKLSSASSTDRPTGASSPSSNSTTTDKDERRARKTLEIEKKNERHMLEQIAQLLVKRGFTSTTKSATASPLPQPIDPQLCERLVQRLVSLFKVSPVLVKTILTEAHNKFVGF